MFIGSMLKGILRPGISVEARRGRIPANGGIRYVFFGLMFSGEDARQ